MSKTSNMTNAELADKVEYWLEELLKSGGKAWRLCVPPQETHDPDIILTEVVERLRKLDNQKEVEYGNI